jgi:hypothetical protein
MHYPNGFSVKDVESSIALLLNFPVRDIRFYEKEVIKVIQMPRKGVGRFQVMAVLQAARAKILGLEESSAKSWGLNRAIFYAAAKRGFKGKPSRQRTSEESGSKPVLDLRDEFYLGDEMAFKASADGESPLFTIGDKIQTVEEFEKSIQSRFGSAFEEAWDEALEYVKQFGKEVLLSQNGFYRNVYKPRRDELAKKWAELATTS